MKPARRLHPDHLAIIVAYALALALFAATALFAHGFASASNIRSLLVQAAFIGIVGLGQTFVILAGGVDLSVAWVLNGAASLLTLWCEGSSASLIWAVPLLLVVGGLVGLVNGIGVTMLAVSPIVMTLGTSGVVQGGVLLITGGSQSPPVPTPLRTLAAGKVFGVPGPVLIWLGLAVLAWLALSRMAFGRRLYAAGSNPVVAQLSGLRVRRITVGAYVISGVSSAVAGVLLAGYVGQAYLGMGDPYLFTSIAAVIIGGASILGGSGHYVGTIAGALTLTVLTGLLPVLDLDPAALQVVYGSVILVTVALGSIRLPMFRADSRPRFRRGARAEPGDERMVEGAAE